MKDSIINLLTNSQKAMDALEITKSVCKSDEVDNIKDVQEALYELEREGTIILTKKNKYRKSDLIKGTVDLHSKGNAHVIVPGRDEDIFIAKPYMHGANHKDTVLVKMISEADNEGAIVKILSRSLGTSVAEVTVHDGKTSIVPFGADELPFNIVVEFDGNIPYVDGQIVSLEYVGEIDRNNVLARAGKVITHKNAPDKDIIMIGAGEFDIRFGFDDEVMSEARSLPQTLDEATINEEIDAGREDFRNEIIFTIDGSDTKDIDDAVCVKFLPNGNYELGVHIADVAHFVKEGSALWNEAGIRGNSNYLGYSVEPMYPAELSNGICSLNPSVNRFTVSCIMEIDPSGKVVKTKIVDGIIRSRKQMDYDSVQKLLDGQKVSGYETLDYILKDKESFEEVIISNNMTLDEAYKYNEKREYRVGDAINIPCYKVLKNMHVLSKTLRGNKKRRGEIDFESNEVKFIFDENKFPIDVVKRVQREAEMIIEDFMIVANEAVARSIYELDLPFVYRVHDVPSPQKIEDFVNYLALLGTNYTGKIDYNNVSSKDIQKLNDYLKDSDNYSALNSRLLRSMQKAVYDPVNRGHFGIASTCYTHFTSPIRRFSDTLVHKCIKNYLIHENYDDAFLDRWDSYISQMCLHISDTERNSEKCERAVDDMFAAKYMTNHIGQEYDAIIDSCLKDGFFVITDKYISGRVDLATINERLKYDENIEGYRGNKNRIVYMPGDKVRVVCTGAYPERREIDFMLVGDTYGNS